MKKSELTLQMAIKKKMTGVKAVKYYNKNISDKLADNILWEETCYPFSNEMFLKQLYQFYISKKLIFKK